MISVLERAKLLRLPNRQRAIAIIVSAILLVVLIVYAAIAISGRLSAGGNNSSSELTPGSGASDSADPDGDLADFGAWDTDYLGIQTNATMATKGNDWLHAEGDLIKDKDGNTVRITGLNWFGYETGTNTVDGLWAGNMGAILHDIANRGFNAIRVPISSQLLLEWKSLVFPPPEVGDNGDLMGRSSLEVFDIFLVRCQKLGIKVVLDIHQPKTGDNSFRDPVWYDSELGITTDLYYEGLEWVAARYARNDTIIGVDLKNEPHGTETDALHSTWNSDENDPMNWHQVATIAANKALDKNPNLLIFVEGTETYPKDPVLNGDFFSKFWDDYYHTEWGSNLRGVKDLPIDLGPRQKQLVYSAHAYGPGVHTVEDKPWLQSGFTYESLLNDYWTPNWLYISLDSIAPIFVGEWGGFLEGSSKDYLEDIKKLIIDNNLSHTFWCLNPNSDDSGGLMNANWTSWDETKYSFVKDTLWQNDGKFIGLSKDVKLGENGTKRP